MGIQDAAMSEEEMKELREIQARQGIVYEIPSETEGPETTENKDKSKGVKNGQ